MRIFPQIYTSRCILTEIKSEDIPSLSSIINAPGFSNYIPDLYHLMSTNQGINQVIRSFDVYLKKDIGLWWGIRYNEVLIGFIAIMDIPVRPTIFYSVHNDYRNKGIMTECIAAVINYIRRTRLFGTIYTEAHIDNEASLKCLRRNGFHKISLINGKYVLTKNIE